MHYSAQPGAIATHIGWPMASVTSLKAQLDGVTNAAEAVLDAQAAPDTAVSLLNTAKGTTMPIVRMDTKNFKATHSFTKGDTKTLSVYVTHETFDLNTYQAVLEVTARHNYVELMAKKLSVDSLNLYWRPAGTANWSLPSAKRTRTPFHDDTPVPAGQTMHACEYMAMRVGNSSNIASAMFQA